MDISLEYLQIYNMVNNAKREIFMKLLPLKDWAYIRTIYIPSPANNTALVGSLGGLTPGPPDIPSPRVLYDGELQTGKNYFNIVSGGYFGSR
ncbi:MAG: hypothetical protein KatS3mg083_120 [Candidatus Dojkabacteria bacterium]|nr:MAG: hypothetical protein KatS3mg083_120 [Candidatus Dojkabacteria bacterium]